MRGVAFFTALAVVVTTPAAAQSYVDGSVKDVASGVAFDYCPAFLERGEPLSLTAELKRRGFSGQPQPRNDDPFFPGLEWFEQRRDDGTVLFSGLAGRACVIKVVGEQAGAVADTWLAQVEKRLPTFTFDKEKSGEVMGINIFVWNAPAEASRRMSLAIAFQSVSEFDENGSVDGGYDQATFQMIFED